MLSIRLTACAVFIFCFLGSINAQFSAAESAEYDASQNRWLVSNGNIIAIAADGTTSTFGNALANYGLEIMGDNVFAVQGNGIRGYDLVSTDQVMTINIPGANFLNGLGSDGVDNLYVSDFGSNKIHQVNVADLSNPVITTIVDDTQTTPNGVIYDGPNNRLLFTSWSGSNAPITAVDLTDFSLSNAVTTTVGRIDGIDEDSEGNYYISSWSPARIIKYNNDFSAAPITITTPFISSPADIGYAKETDSLAIPIGSNVVFVDLAPDTISGIEHLKKENFQLVVSPNPSRGAAQINFFLEKSQAVDLILFDQEGKLQSILLEGIQSYGYHKISLAGHSFSAGQYYLVLTTKQGRQTVPVVLSN